MKFKRGYRFDGDRWGHDGPKIASLEHLAAIKSALEKDGPILVQHRFLRGARSPHNQAFDDYDDFVDYLTENARAGDNIIVWNLASFIRDTPPLAQGKCPDDDGMVPKGGAY